MQRTLRAAVSLLTAGMMMVGNVLAQQTPATSSQQPTATKAHPAPAVDGQKAPAAKTGQATRPRIQSVLMLNTQKEKLSYALEMKIGNNMQNQLDTVEPAIVLLGTNGDIAKCDDL